MASTATTMVAECTAAAEPKRVLWSAETTTALIHLWENHLEALRSTSRNAKIYRAMVEQLNEGLPANEGPYNVKQLRQKLNNLTKRYKKEHREGSKTGGEPVAWPYYDLLHSFLGSLPMNDDDLMEENMEVPVVDEAPEYAELIASWDFTEAAPASEPTPADAGQSSTTNGCPHNGLATAGPSRATTTTTHTAGPSSPEATTARGTSARNRAANSSVLHQLLALHKEDSIRAAKADKRRHRLQVQMLRLQKEANTMQAGMVEMIRDFFASKTNKSQ